MLKTAMCNRQIAILTFQLPLPLILSSSSSRINPDPMFLFLLSRDQYTTNNGHLPKPTSCSPPSAPQRLYDNTTVVNPHHSWSEKPPHFHQPIRKIPRYLFRMDLSIFSLPTPGFFATVRTHTHRLPYPKHWSASTQTSGQQQD